jgi:hypothetical protein
MKRIPVIELNSQVVTDKSQVKVGDYLVNVNALAYNTKKYAPLVKVVALQGYNEHVLVIEYAPGLTHYLAWDQILWNKAYELVLN